MSSAKECRNIRKTFNRVTRRCRKKCVPPRHRKPHTRKCILACKKGEKRSGPYNHCKRKKA